MKPPGCRPSSHSRRAPSALTSPPHRHVDAVSSALTERDGDVRISDMNWMQVEAYLRHDDRAVQRLATEWAADHTGCKVLFHNWWNAPKTWAKVQASDPDSSHGSWMENFPWTRVPGVTLPDGGRPMTPVEQIRMMDPVALRKHLGDGNFGGRYQRSDEDVLALWQIAVEETRALLAG